jgi:poly-gamma-glutamate system protein
VRPKQIVDRELKTRLVVAALVSLVAWPLVQRVATVGWIDWTDEMLEAAETMREAIHALAEHCAAADIAIDESLDPNRTCLIGPEYTPLFTTLGRLEAKRTSTNPDMAALVVHLLQRAGVSPGDRIAVGASASFPALTIATLVAADVLDVYPVTILSLGASSYGATRPEFNLLDIYELLVEQRMLSAGATAVSLGGAGDVGAELDPDVREALVRQIQARGKPLVHDGDLGSNVARRMQFYSGEGIDRAIKVFVNIGGGDANLGSSPLVLEVEPGLNTDFALPPAEQRGVLFEMAAMDVPVIHLLNVRGLVLRYGLPWDPVPLPEPGSGRLHEPLELHDWRFWAITAAYFLCLGVVAIAGSDRGRNDEQYNLRMGIES